MKLGFKKITSKNPQFILLAEFHGVKQNLEILQEAVDLYLSFNTPIVIALEWPGRLNQEINDFISGKDTKLKWKEREFPRNPDGRLSRDFMEFFSWLREKNITRKSGLKASILCTDEAGEVWHGATWNQRDRWMGKSLLKSARENPEATIIGIFGNIHANKNKVNIDGKVRIPAANYLPRAKTISIKLRYLSGSFFNVGLQRIETSKRKMGNKDDFRLNKIRKTSSKWNQGFDYEILVPKATPVKLLGKFNPKTNLVEF